MKRWREDQRVRARLKAGPRPEKGSFVEDVDGYLAQVAAMPSLDCRRRDLYVWRERFADRPRSTITAGMIREALHEWRSVGPMYHHQPRTKEFSRIAKPLSASACNHRCTA